MLAFALVAAIYVMAYRDGLPETEARALAFFSLVTGVVALILVNRSFSASLLAALRGPNRAFKFVLAGVTGILGLTLAWPMAANLFRFGPLHANDLALTLLAGLIVLLLREGLKPWWAARLKG